MQTRINEFILPPDNLQGSLLSTILNSFHTTPLKPKELRLLKERLTHTSSPTAQRASILLCFCFHLASQKSLFHRNLTAQCIQQLQQSNPIDNLTQLITEKIAQKKLLEGLSLIELLCKQNQEMGLKKLKAILHGTIYYLLVEKIEETFPFIFTKILQPAIKTGDKTAFALFFSLTLGSKISLVTDSKIASSFFSTLTECLLQGSQEAAQCLKHLFDNGCYSKEIIILKDRLETHYKKNPTICPVTIKFAIGLIHKASLIKNKPLSDFLYTHLYPPCLHYLNESLQDSSTTDKVTRNEIKLLRAEVSYYFSREEKEKQSAKKALQKLSKEGLLDACQILHHDELSTDEEKTLLSLQEQAEKNNKGAISLLSAVYFSKLEEIRNQNTQRPNCTNQNDLVSQAIYWSKKALENGDRDAANRLGIIYHHGYGGVVDHALAEQYYKLAIEKGHLFAHTNLGILYEIKNPPLYAQAFHLYQKTAITYHLGLAWTFLANAYAFGRGVLKDEHKALECFALAQKDLSSQYLPEFYYYLGLFYYTASESFKDEQKSRAYFKKATEWNFPKANFYYAELLLHGRGGPKEARTGIIYYEKAFQTCTDLVMRTTAAFNVVNYSLQLISPKASRSFIEEIGIILEKKINWLEKSLDEGFFPNNPFRLQILNCLNRVYTAFSKKS